ncbi:metal ABC transporter substrate-binding protein, partial [Streptomyces sp. C1-2]|nr:metal ABC transporter substrate-binding protein [Streptomyces sp. C1-2]
MRNTAKITTAALAVTALTLGLSACGSDSEDSGKADPNATLTVAATPTPQGEILTYVKDKLAKKAG